jgi:hypothetical protein
VLGSDWRTSEWNGSWAGSSLQPSSSAVSRASTGAKWPDPWELRTTAESKTRAATRAAVRQEATLAPFDLFLRLFQAETGLFAKEFDRIDLPAGDHQLLDGPRDGRPDARAGHLDRFIAT